MPLLAEGEFALVRHHLEEALQTSDTTLGDHDLCAMLAEVAARQRDCVALHQYAPLAEAMAARYSDKLNQAIAHRAWGVAHRLAGEYADAEARLNQALALFRELDTRWQIGRTLYELGELAATCTNVAAAHDYFSEALAAFEEMRAVPDAARTRAVLETIK